MLGKFDDLRKEEATKTEPCTRRMNVLAHSMGNRVFRNTINNGVKYDMMETCLSYSVTYL
jgi:hypothetical protein